MDSHRHWAVLQRLHAVLDGSTSTLYALQAFKHRRVQQCLEERQTWPHRVRNRLRMDMGGNLGPFCLISECHLANLPFSYNPAQ
jgi:hypothetical protein